MSNAISRLRASSQLSPAQVTNRAIATKLVDEWKDTLHGDEDIEEKQKKLDKHRAELAKQERQSKLSRIKARFQ